MRFRQFLELSFHLGLPRSRRQFERFVRASWPARFDLDPLALGLRTHFRSHLRLAVQGLDLPRDVLQLTSDSSEGAFKLRFVDAIDVVFDSTIPYNVRFFEALDRFVQREPWLERDKAMINSLKTIGIEKGKPYKPDARTRKILGDAAREAQAWLDFKYQGIFSPPFNEGTHWALPAAPGVAEGMMTNFASPDAYPVEGRGIAYSMAFFSAKHLGEGQYYLMTIVDKTGQPLNGGRNYR